MDEALELARRLKELSPNERLRLFGDMVGRAFQLRGPALAQALDGNARLATALRQLGVEPWTHVWVPN